MSGFNLLRNSSKALNLFVRSQSTRSSLLTQNITAKKSSILLKAPVQSNLQAVRSNSGVAVAKHWNLERYFSVGLLAVIPAALVLENTYVDHLFAASVTLHSMWGLKMVITDYIHPPQQQKAALGALYLFSALALVGCIYFNTVDMGLSKAVKKLWAL